MPDRRYSDTGLRLMKWHLSVMHDRHMSLSARMESAAELLRLWPEVWPDTYHSMPADLTIIIKGLGIEAPEVSVQAEDRGPWLVGHA